MNAPKLSFDHYVATEGGYDGGNVKVSGNGGAFTEIPPSAFVFNPYNTTLQDTNPSGGEAGLHRYRRWRADRVVGHHDRQPGQHRREGW